jgi:hypothetical protein
MNSPGLQVGQGPKGMCHVARTNPWDGDGRMVTRGRKGKQVHELGQFRNVYSVEGINHRSLTHLTVGDDGSTSEKAWWSMEGYVCHDPHCEPNNPPRTKAEMMARVCGETGDIMSCRAVNDSGWCRAIISCSRPKTEAFGRGRDRHHAECSSPCLSEPTREDI